MALLPPETNPAALFLGQLDVYRRSSKSIKNNLHGSIYQLKLLMLNAYQAWKNGYTFILATEMQDAEKFDDIVIWYIDEHKSKSDILVRCLQAKHSWDKKKKIRDADLLSEKDRAQFSLVKYFDSYRKIIKHLDKKTKALTEGNIELEFCVIQTNLPLELKDLETKEIGNDRRKYKSHQLLSDKDNNPKIYETLRKKWRSNISDDAKDMEIKCFLEKLIIAADQPDEAKLGKVMNTRIRKNEKLNEQEAFFVTNSFQVMMLDWLQKPGENEKFEVPYRTHQDIDKFFEYVLKKTGNNAVQNPSYTLHTDPGKKSESEESKDSVPQREEE